jgi:patatin-like phospholipase/acyl hydrolase
MRTPTVGNYRTDAPMPKDGKYRIITFDGGGLRSVVSITILERLVEVFPDLLERVNLFCGTSGSSGLPPLSSPLP